jgi:DNA-binding NarL/FixJ family response regulator
MRIAIADDSVLIREGLSRILTAGGVDVVAEATDGSELLARVDELQPDAVIVDIRMPPSFTDEGIQVAARLRNQHPNLGVLVLSQYVSSSYALRVLGTGTGRIGYLLKDRIANTEEVVDAVRRVTAGETVVDPQVVARLVNRSRDNEPLDRLTDREREVLALIAEGRSNKAICDKLFLSPKTVATHVNAIFTKLDLSVAAEDHRRVLAVLQYLRASASPQP